MSLVHHGAQRASRRPLRSVAIVLFATVFAVAGLVATPRPAEASGLKVVIVVGPAGGRTSDYIYNARKLAAQARSYGANVIEIYSPNATWTRVKPAAQGANVLIYLGHGNGHPSPYGAFRPNSKDGLGLNAAARRGHHNVKYWGESYVARDIKLAPNAVVILNRLCYASGNSEPGRANPTRAVAIQRVDNYAAGFLRSGARAVFAEGIKPAGYVLAGLFHSDKTMTEIFWSAPSRTRSWSFGFESRRNPGYQGLLDPRSPGRYYRSVVGSLAMTATEVREPIVAATSVSEPVAP